MNRKQPVAPNRNIMLQMNETSSQSSFADLNPLPGSSGKKSVEHSIVQSIEIEVEGHRSATKPSSALVSQELSAEVDEVSKSLNEAPAEQSLRQPDGQLQEQQKLILQPEIPQCEVVQHSQLVARAEPIMQTSKSQIVMPEQPSVNVKMPYTQLAHPGQLGNDSLQNSSSAKRKTEGMAGKVLTSVIIGGVAALIAYFVSGRKGGVAAGAGLVTSLVTFHTQRKAP